MLACSQMIINSNCLLARRLPKNAKQTNKKLMQLILFTELITHVFKEELHQLILPPLIKLNYWKIKWNRFRPYFISFYSKLASHNLEHELLRLKFKDSMNLSASRLSRELHFNFYCDSKPYHYMSISRAIQFRASKYFDEFLFVFVMQGELFEVFVGRRRRCIFVVDRIIAFFDTYHFLLLS